MWVNDLMRKNHYCIKLTLLTSVSKNMNNQMMRFGHKIHNFECACISTYGFEKIQWLQRNNCEKMCAKVHINVNCYCCPILALHFTLDYTQNNINYRPQRSCGKVMFLHLSVSLSVHRGVSGRPPPGRPPPPDGQCSGRYASYWNAFLLKLLESMSTFFG